MNCPQCETLREEIAYLKGELGLQVDRDAIERLRCALGLHRGTARMLFALYSAKGRSISRWLLNDLIPSDNPDRDPKTADVYCSLLRRALGKDAVLNTWGEGYRLSPQALSKVSEILGEGGA